MCSWDKKEKKWMFYSHWKQHECSQVGSCSLACTIKYYTFLRRFTFFFFILTQMREVHWSAINILTYLRLEDAKNSDRAENTKRRMIKMSWSDRSSLWVSKRPFRSEKQSRFRSGWIRLVRRVRKKCLIFETSFF